MSTPCLCPQVCQLTAVRITIISGEGHYQDTTGPAILSGDTEGILLPHVINRKVRQISQAIQS